MAGTTVRPPSAASVTIDHRADARRAPTAEELRHAAHAVDGRYRDDLAHLVGIDSGSHDAEGVTRVAEWAAATLAADGFDVETVPTSEHDGRRFGPVVVARRRGTGTARVVLFAHMDTVFPAGTAAERPFRIADGIAYGPGVCDDVAGIAAGIAAARVLDRLGYAAYGELVIALTPDEEIGSPASREILAEVARGRMPRCASSARGRTATWSAPARAWPTSSSRSTVVPRTRASSPSAASTPRSRRPGCCSTCRRCQARSPG